MSSSAAVIRTQGLSLMGAWSLNTPHSIFLPTPPSQAKAHIREELDTQNTQLLFQGLSTITFQIQRDVDFITQLDLVLTTIGHPSTTWSTNATFFRRVDLFALSAWLQCRISSGTQRLQTIRPLETYVHMNKCYSETKRQNMLANAGRQTPFERTRDNVGQQEYRCPMLTAIGFGMYGDPSQGVYIRGLNDFLKVEFDMDDVLNLIESDGTAPLTGTITNANMYVQGLANFFGCFLACEGWHLGKVERSKLAEVYKSSPFSVVFNDFQYSQAIQIGTAATGAQLLTGAFTQPLLNITQPVTYLTFVMQWIADLQRQAGGQGGTRGRNKWNLAGWFNAGGLESAIISTFSLVTGNNNIIRTIPAVRLATYNHARDFKGTQVPAIPAASYSYDASAVNAVLGFVSFEQIDQPQLTIQFQQPFVDGSGTAPTTLANIETIDIGTSPTPLGMQVTVVAATKNLIDFVSVSLSHLNFILTTFPGELSAQPPV